MTEFQETALALLAPSPTNPRKHFAELEGLAESIKAQGVMQPILIRPWPDDYPTPEGRDTRPLYEIVAGERRYRASLLAGLDTIPTLVRPLTTRQVLEAQIVENLQRRDVTELEEAEGYQLMMRDHGYSADELADKVGKSRAYIYARLKLTALCAEARQFYRDGKLDASRALLIARIPVPALQVQAAKEIIREGHFEGPMSARQAAAHIQHRYMLDLAKAPFGRDAHYVVTIEAGLGGKGPLGLVTCVDCPKRTGNDPEAYPGIDPDVCTDPNCYADKRAAHLAEAAARAREGGHKVITGEAAKKIAPHGIYGPTAGNYVALDEKDYYGGHYQTARKAIKGHDVPIVMIEDHRKGTLVPMVAKQDLSEALKAAGIQPSKSNRDPRELAREKARKAEKQFRRALFDAHHAATQTQLNAATTPKPALSRDDLALIARQFFSARGSETSKILARMYVPDAPARGPGDSEYQDEDYRRCRRLTEMIDEASAPQLMLLLLDLALVSTLDVPTYTDDIATPAPLVAAAERAGLNVDRIRASMAGNPAAEKTAPTPPQAAPAGECSAPKFEAGQRVRIRPGACWDNGTPINADDTPGTIQGAAGGDGYDVLFQNGVRRHYLPEIALELAASEGASTPEQAAPAGDDLAQPPKAKSAARAKQAAPARAVKTAKPKAQAADAARKPKEKAKTSGRVAAAGGKGKPADEPPPHRCPNTLDMLEGASA
ncbi:MAG: ParB/RepB/Spo0J family partition protein [Thauera sp.]